MKGWSVISLGSISNVTSSKRIFANQYVNSGIPFYRQKEIIEKKNFEPISEPIFISNETYESIKSQFGVPKNGDLLITAVGVSLGIAYIVGDEKFYFKDGNLIWLHDFDSKINSKYIYYWISSEQGHSKMWSRIIGSAQPALTIDIIKQCEIPIPEFEVQNEIVKILSAYDDLIENNKKQIKLLEEAAQRLYKEWFVDLHFPGYENTKIVNGMPEGWSIKSIDEIADYLNGFAFKPSDWENDGKPIIKIKELNEGITRDTPRNSGENVPKKYVVKSGDIIFSWSATLTAKIWDSEEGLLNQHLFKVTPNIGYGREFVLQSILFTLSEFQNLTTGSTMRHIQRGKLKQVFIKVPDKTIMEKYQQYSEIIRNLIINLQHQIELATESRDRLLPKLMSGEIEV